MGETMETLIANYLFTQGWRYDEDADAFVHDGHPGDFRVIEAAAAQLAAERKHYRQQDA